MVIKIINYIALYKVRRRKSLFDLLVGTPAQLLKKRLDEEIRKVISF